MAANSRFHYGADGWGEPDAPSGYDPDFSKGQILCSWESIVIRLTLKED